MAATKEGTGACAGPRCMMLKPSGTSAIFQAPVPTSQFRKGSSNN